MKTMIILGGIAVTAGGALFGNASDANAQSRPISEIVVFGEDPCPRSTDDNVVVCARKPESERYRVPERFRESGSRQERQSWAANARYLETVNNTGIQQCSPVGPNGFTGCLDQLINTSRAEREELEDEEVYVPE